MKNNFKRIFGLLLVLLVAFTLVSCKKDPEPNPDPNPPVDPTPDPEPEFDALPTSDAADFMSIADFVKNVAVTPNKADTVENATIVGVVTSLAPYNSYSIEDGTGAVALRVGGKNTSNIDFKVGDAVVAKVKKEEFNGLVQATVDGAYTVHEGNYERMDVVDLNDKGLDSEVLKAFQGRTVSLANGVVDSISIDSHGTIVITIKLGDETIEARWDNRVTAVDVSTIKHLIKDDNISIVEATLGWHNGPQIAIGRTSEVTTTANVEVVSVTFDSNGGSAVAKVDLRKGTLLTLPKAPTKAKAEFDGWYTDVELTTEFDAEAVVTANVTLYAKWEASASLKATAGLLEGHVNGNVNNEDFAALIGLDPEIFDVLSTERKGSPLHISLYTNEGGQVRMYNNAEGGNIFTIRIREGYKIVGFEFTLATANLTSANFVHGSETEVLEINKQKGEVVKYDDFEVSEIRLEVTGGAAFWIQSDFVISYIEDGTPAATVRHKVEFETNGGDAIADKMIKNNTRVQTVKPDKEGEKFLGWFTDAELTTEFVDTTPITAPIKLYAKWEGKSDEELLAEAKSALTIDTDTVTENKTLILVTEGLNDVVITWEAVEGASVIDLLTGLITMPNESTTLVLEATLTLNEVVDTKEFTIEIFVAVEGKTDFTQDFTDVTLTSSYANFNFISEDGSVWEGKGRDEGDFAIDGKGVMLQRGSDGYIQATFSDGLSSLSFDFRKAFTGGTSRSVDVIINDGEALTFELGTPSGASELVKNVVINDLKLTGNVVVKIKPTTSGNHQITLDNFAWSINPAE